MNKSRRLVINFILFAVLSFYLLSYLGIVEISITSITAYGLMSYGIVTVYFALGTNKKALLFFNTVVFLSGVIVYILNNYNFGNTRDMILPAMMFMVGSGFIMLFIDDTSNRVFLISAALLMVSSVIYILLGRGIRLLSLANVFAGIVLDYYPVFIILIGINILLNRKR